MDAKDVIAGWVQLCCCDQLGLEVGCQPFPYGPPSQAHNTISFESDTKALEKCMLKYYRISYSAFDMERGREVGRSLSSLLLCTEDDSS